MAHRRGTHADIDPRELRDRSWPVGFDVPGWRCGGAAHDTGFGVIELDGERGNVA
jgi:hypothetical protein